MEPHKNRYVYLIQMRTGTLPDRLIRFLTRYEYSHVVISLDRSCKTTYSYGRRTVYNFLNSGFVVEKQNGAFFKRFHNTFCRIHEIQVTESQYNYLQKLLIHRTVRKKEYKYDFFGIVLRFFQIPVWREKHAVCTQFAAEILEQAGIIRFDKPCYFMRAGDFNKYRQLKVIYEGRYVSYEPITIPG